MSQTNKPRTFKTTPQTASLLIEINPLVSKVTRRLQEDAESKIDSSTALFFGFLFLVGIFVISLLLYNNKPLLNIGDGDPNQPSDALETSNGRGTNMPNVVPPANSPEGQEYMRQHEAQQEREQESKESKEPKRAPQVRREEYYDQYGQLIDPKTIDFTQYNVKEAI